MARGPDAATLLERALCAKAAVAVVQAECDRWASATFEGMRHRLTVEGTDDAATRAWLAGLADADWRLRGHLVADIQVASVKRADGRLRARIEALTVEDR